MFLHIGQKFLHLPGCVRFCDIAIDSSVCGFRLHAGKDVYGNFALSGSIFLSSANQPDFTDPYNLIYGHHMSNGAMFGDVVEFTDEAYFTAHETGTLYLPEETRSITIFACVEAEARHRHLH